MNAHEWIYLAGLVFQFVSQWLRDAKFKRVFVESIEQHERRLTRLEWLHGIKEKVWLK